jgi:hypothetical protein
VCSLLAGQGVHMSIDLATALLSAWGAASTLVGVLLTASGAIAARRFVGSIRSAELGIKETRESLARRWNG